MCPSARPTPEAAPGAAAARARHRHPLAVLGALLVGAGSLAYAAWGLDLAAFAAAFGRFSPERIAVLVGISIASYPVLGARLRFLAGNRFGPGTGTKAAVLAVGLNSVLPARIGEAVKVLYLHRNSPHSYPRLLGIVFWERFADLNALLLVAVAAALLLGIPLAVLPVAVVVLGAWGIVVLPSLAPALARRLTAWVPHAGLKRGLRRLFRLVHAGLKPRVLAGLAGYTAVFWGLALAQVAAMLLWVAQMPIGPGPAFAVFVVTTAGIAIPAAPGGLGLYEAAFVLSLGWYGIAREEALAAALALHAAVLAPPVLGSAWVLLREGLPLPRFAHGR